METKEDFEITLYVASLLEEATKILKEERTLRNHLCMVAINKLTKQYIKKCPEGIKMDFEFHKRNIFEEWKNPK